MTEIKIKLASTRVLKMSHCPLVLLIPQWSK